MGKWDWYVIMAYHYTWQQLHADTHKICDWVKAVNFNPDFIVGITRGGAIPAIIASHHLNVPVKFLEWSTRDANKQDLATLAIYAQDIHKNAKVIFVDDIIDSGKTIAGIKRELIATPESFRKNILFTSLWYNPRQTQTTAHYWANIIDRAVDDRWILFPYEV